MSENKDLRRRQKNKGKPEQAADIPMMATIRPGARTTGIIKPTHLYNVIQNASHIEGHQVLKYQSSQPSKALDDPQYDSH